MVQRLVLPIAETQDSSRKAAKKEQGRGDKAEEDAGTLGREGQFALSILDLISF